MKRLNMMVLAVLMLLAIVGSVHAQAPYRDAPQGPSTTETLRQPTMPSGLTGFLDPTSIVGVRCPSQGGVGLVTAFPPALKVAWISNTGFVRSIPQSFF